MWALEDLNLRPLPRQGRQRQASDQHFPSSGSISDMTRVSLPTLECTRLLDQMLTGYETSSDWTALNGLGVRVHRPPRLPTVDR
jgi:hypothetical protein